MGEVDAFAFLSSRVEAYTQEIALLKTTEQLICPMSNNEMSSMAPETYTYCEVCGTNGHFGFECSYNFYNSQNTHLGQLNSFEEGYGYNQYSNTFDQECMDHSNICIITYFFIYSFHIKEYYTSTITIMALPHFNNLPDLQLNGRENWNIRVRVSRIWRSMNTHTGEVHGLNIIFVDETVSRIHAWVTIPQIHTMEQHLQEGQCIIVTNFTVSQYNEHRRNICFQNHIFITLNNNTIILPVPETMNIPQHVFKFTNFADLHSVDNENRYLIDIIGMITQNLSYHNQLQFQQQCYQQYEQPSLQQYQYPPILQQELQVFQTNVDVEPNQTSEEYDLLKKLQKSFEESAEAIKELKTESLMIESQIVHLASSSISWQLNSLPQPSLQPEDDMCAIILTSDEEYESFSMCVDDVTSNSNEEHDTDD